MRTPTFISIADNCRKSNARRPFSEVGLFVGRFVVALSSEAQLEKNKNLTVIKMAPFSIFSEDDLLPFSSCFRGVFCCNEVVEHLLDVNNPGLWLSYDDVGEKRRAGFPKMFINVDGLSHSCFERTKSPSPLHCLTKVSRNVDETAKKERKKKRTLLRHMQAEGTNNQKFRSAF